MSNSHRRSARLAIVATAVAAKDVVNFKLKESKAVKLPIGEHHDAGPSRIRKRVQEYSDGVQHISRKKKKASEEPRPEDYPARVRNEWKIGPHVSAAGGVENAIQNAASVGWLSPFIL